MTTYLSLALVPEIIMSSGLAPGGPEPRMRKVDSARAISSSFIDMKTVIWIVFSIPCMMVFAAFFNGIVKVLWENPAKKSPKT